MHRLFWKIFLWFWLGMVVVSATLLISTALTRSRSREDEEWRERYTLPLDLRAQRTAEFLGRGDASSAQRYLNALEQRDSIKNYVFNEGGSEVLGSQAPRQVLRVEASVIRRPAGESFFFSARRLAAERMVAPSGRSYVLIMAFPPPAVLPAPLLDFMFEDIGRDGILRLIAVLLVAGLFCFWLARHITNPIEKLQAATHEVAQEHLDARVDEAVTARRDELAELGRRFNQMAERIGDLVATQKRLLADISHELRSPLARSNVALALARQHAAPETSEHLERIEREMDRLNQLIGQILALARMDSAVDLERKEVFDLAVMLQEIAADGDYEARGCHAAVKLAAPSECFIEGAPEMLRSAIENVVRNAIHHTSEGTTVEIILNGRRANEGLRADISVRDYGPGVPEDGIGRIFEPFYRLPDDARGVSNGSGLGLAITDRAVRLHGGRVTAANASGGGLLVTIELPRAGNHTKA